MPPQIAIVIFIVFVIWLLRIERRHAPKHSMALWIPTVWMLYICSKPLDLWFQSGGGGDIESGSPLDRLFLCVLLIIGFIIIIIKRIDLNVVMRNNICLVLLILFMLLSVVWSNQLYISFKRWFRELVALFMALVVFTEGYPREALQSLFRRTIYILIPLSYPLIHYYPELGREYGRWSGGEMWIGVATQKNGFARLCLFSVYFIIWTFVKGKCEETKTNASLRRYIDIFILAMALWFMGGPEHTLTYSATSSLVLLVGLLLLFGLLWARRYGMKLKANIYKTIIMGIIIYGTTTPFIGGLSMIDISSALGRDKNLTGRSEIWATLIPYAMMHPIVGYGFGGFWTTAMRELTSSHAHNGYLDIILNCGFIGLLFVIMFIISCCRKIELIMDQDYLLGCFWSCWLLMLLIYNITESSLGTFNGQLPALFLFLSIAECSLVKETKADIICKSDNNKYGLNFRNRFVRKAIAL
jgi:exopolysaccharide production protein ExoQ